MKLKLEDVPRHLGQQDVSAYFPHGETAVTKLLEGQLAFLQHVHLYEENHKGSCVGSNPGLELGFKSRLNLGSKPGSLGCCCLPLPPSESSGEGTRKQQQPRNPGLEPG